jgi:hypothetical protein
VDSLTNIVVSGLPIEVILLFKKLVESFSNLAWADGGCIK